MSSLAFSSYSKCNHHTSSALIHISQLLSNLSSLSDHPAQLQCLSIAANLTFRFIITATHNGNKWIDAYHFIPTCNQYITVYYALMISYLYQTDAVLQELMILVSHLYLMLSSRIQSLKLSLKPPPFQDTKP